MSTPTAELGDLFQRYGQQLHRYCASRVGPGAAEDVVAEAFLVAHQRRDRYDPAAGSPVAWSWAMLASPTSIAAGSPPTCSAAHRRAEVRAFRALARQ